jgi:hypothetical protein
LRLITFACPRPGCGKSTVAKKEEGATGRVQVQCQRCKALLWVDLTREIVEAA